MRALLVLITMLLMGAAAQAHEVRPALLDITQDEAGEVQLVWKFPIIQGRALALSPRLPSGCERGEAMSRQRLSDTIVERWTGQCGLSEGIIVIEGLEVTLTDVFLRLSRADGSVLTAVLTAQSPALDLSDASGTAVLAYLWIGVEHIWFGYDHLLFVLGLLVLVRPRQLFGVITSFTLAHSLTLGMAALGAVSLPGRPIESLIAISIVLLAVEALRVSRGQSSLAAQRPWLIGFGIGLVHGFGFAGALAEIGLPRGAELAALFFFNLGVELGQVSFVLVCLGLAFVVARARPRLAGAGRFAIIYALGSVGAFWTLERLAGWA